MPTDGRCCRALVTTFLPQGEPYLWFPSGQEPTTGPPSRTDRYSPPAAPFLQLTHFAAWPMTSEQAAQLIDDTLDLVHQRLQELEATEHQRDQKALAAEFREWRQPLGGHIDLMVCPGFPAV